MTHEEFIKITTRTTSALLKQIAEKPVDDKCPVCGTLVRYYMRPLDRNWEQEVCDDHCSLCGQKMNWV